MAPLRQSVSKKVRLLYLILLLLITSSFISAQPRRLLSEVDEDLPIIKKKSNSITRISTKPCTTSPSTSSKNQTKLIKPTTTSNSLASKNQTKVITKLTSDSSKNKTKLIKATSSSSNSTIKSPLKKLNSTSKISPKSTLPTKKTSDPNKLASPKNKTTKPNPSKESKSQIEKSVLATKSNNKSLKKPSWIDEEDDEDNLVAEFRELPSKFQETIVPYLEKISQTFVGFAVELNYYVTVFHRAFMHQPPRTSWKVHALYATCFLVICLLARVDRRKKAYLEEGGGEGKKGNSCLDASPPINLESEDTSHGTVGPSNKYDQEASKPPEKVLRRLAQNREAARKSRLRKKAYVQQLENSKLRLLQLEQELGRARQQGLYTGSALDASPLGYAGSISPGIATFEMEYGHWVEEQDRQLSDLRNALHSEIGEMELRIFVDGGLRHYFDLFTMKATAAKADVFYVMSGMWKTSAERFFFWIGGFRPSELLKVLQPHLEPLSEQQRLDIGNLVQSCQQAEEALSQGMERVHQILGVAIAIQLGKGNYLPQIGAAMEKFEDLIRFVDQADHLRQETLQQISRILTTRQAARGLLALGEYFQRLRELSSLRSSWPRESS